MKRKTAGYIKETVKSLLIILTMLAVFKLGSIYGRYSEPEQKPLDFFKTYEQKYEWNNMWGMPEKVNIQIKEYNSLGNLLRLTVLLVPIIWIFGYLESPENHFLDKIIKKLKANEVKE